MKNLLLSILFIAFSALCFSQSINKVVLDNYLSANKNELMGLKRGFDVKIIQHEKLLYQYQYGKIGDDTPILIASASKWLSGALIMKLVDEKLISLNDPISKFFPSAPQDKQAITIKQLFSHTSGLPGKGTFELIRMNGKSMEQQCKEILAKDLAAKPGTTFSYGGESMQIAGRIAEIVTKKDFETLFQEKIAKPLEMKNTTFTKEDKTPQVAGGATSTVNDYLNFLNMIAHKGVYKGKRILSDAAVKAMLDNQIGNPTISYSPFEKYEYLFPAPIKMKYGIGNWREESYKGTLMISSSPGAFGFTPWIDFEYGYYGVLGTLKSTKSVFPVYLNFRDQLNQQLNKP